VTSGSTIDASFVDNEGEDIVEYGYLHVGPTGGQFVEFQISPQPGAGQSQQFSFSLDYKNIGTGIILNTGNNNIKITWYI
jgi:hypothetical protein